MDSSVPQSAPLTLLDVLRTTDLTTQRRFISCLGLRGALSLRSTCRNATTFVDTLLSEPLELRFCAITHNPEEGWRLSLADALSAVTKWSRCHSLALTAVALGPTSARGSGSNAPGLAFVIGPLLEAAARGGTLPHVTSFRLHLDVAGQQPRVRRSGDEAPSHRPHPGSYPGTYQQQNSNSNPNPNPNQHHQVVQWLLHHCGDGGDSAGGDRGTGSNVAGAGDPRAAPARRSATSAVLTPEEVLTASPLSGAGCSGSYGDGGGGSGVAWRSTVPPLELTYDLAAALAALFPSLESLAFSGHWAELRPSAGAPTPEPRGLDGSPNPAATSGSPAPQDRAQEHMAPPGPLAALARLRHLRRLELPAALVYDPRIVEASGLAALGASRPSALPPPPPLEELTIRTDSQSMALRQRTQLSWPRAVRGALPALRSLTLLGGYSHVEKLLLPEHGGGVDAAGGVPGSALSPTAAATPPVPPLRPLRLSLCEHLAFLPELLPARGLLFDPDRGLLLLRGSLNIRILGVCLRLFGSAAALQAAAAPASGGGEGNGLAPQALAGAGQPARGQSSGTCTTGGCGSGCHGAAAAGPGGLRRVVVTGLLLNRAPSESELGLLEDFTSLPGCALLVRELVVTYPECGGGGGDDDNGAEADAGWDGGGVGAAEQSDGVGVGGCSNVARALALSAARCVRLEVRLPAGSPGLLRAAMRELGRLPPGLLPSEVEVEMVGWQPEEGRREDGEGVTARGLRAPAPPMTAAAAVAAALEPYGHLRDAVRVVVRE